MKVPALNAALAGIAMLAAAAFLVLDDDGSGGPEPAGGVDPRGAPRARPASQARNGRARAGRHPRPHIRPRPSGPGRRVDLLDSPGGRVVARVGDETEFGSLRRFWVAGRGDWFGVPAPELGNGELGWIRDDRTVLDVSQTHYSIVADVSEQTVGLRYGDRVLDRIPVTVGSQSSPTPLGEYAVTDGLVGEGVGPYYGCCTRPHRAPAEPPRTGWAETGSRSMAP